jgi:hypothetical protein
MLCWTGYEKIATAWPPQKHLIHRSVDQPQKKHVLGLGADGGPPEHRDEGRDRHQQAARAVRTARRHRHRVAQGGVDAVRGHRLHELHGAVVQPRGGALEIQVHCFLGDVLAEEQAVAVVFDMGGAVRAATAAAAATTTTTTGRRLVARRKHFHAAPGLLQNVADARRHDCWRGGGASGEAATAATARERDWEAGE